MIERTQYPTGKDSNVMNVGSHKQELESSYMDAKLVAALLPVSSGADLSLYIATIIPLFPFLSSTFL